MGGKLHLKLHMGSRPIANKYHEGKLKRTLKRKVKVLEITEKEVSEANVSLVRLLHTSAIACCANACVSVSLEQAARSASCLACQCRFTREEDFKGMVAPLTVRIFLCVLMRGVLREQMAALDPS